MFYKVEWLFWANVLMMMGEMTHGLMTLLDQHNGESNIAFGLGARDQWQSFTVGTSGELSAVEWMIQCPLVAGGAQPVTLSLYQGQGVDGLLLAESAGLTSPNVMGPRAFVSFDVSSLHLEVDTSDIYTVRISTPNNDVSWLPASPDTSYARGVSNLNGVDYIFRTYVTPVPRGNIDQSNSLANDMFALGDKDQWQSFTVGVTGSLSSVQWYMRSPLLDGSSQPVVLSVYAGQGVSGALLAESSGLMSPGSSKDYVTFVTTDFNINVHAGEVYTVRLTTAATQVSWIPCGSSSSYAGGVANLGVAYLFNTFVIPAPPAPCSRLLSDVAPSSFSHVGIFSVMCIVAFVSYSAGKRVGNVATSYAPLPVKSAHAEGQLSVPMSLV